MYIFFCFIHMFKQHIYGTHVFVLKEFSAGIAMRRSNKNITGFMFVFCHRHTIFRGRGLALMSWQCYRVFGSNSLVNTHTTLRHAHTLYGNHCFCFCSSFGLVWQNLLQEKCSLALW